MTNSKFTLLVLNRPYSPDKFIFSVVNYSVDSVHRFDRVQRFHSVHNVHRVPSVDSSQYWPADQSIYLYRSLFKAYISQFALTCEVYKFQPVEIPKYTDDDMLQTSYRPFPDADKGVGRSLALC